MTLLTNIFDIGIKPKKKKKKQIYLNKQEKAIKRQVEASQRIVFLEGQA